MPQTQYSSFWRPPTPPPMPPPLYIPYSQTPYPPRSSPYSASGAKAGVPQSVIVQEDDDSTVNGNNCAVILIQSMLIIFNTTALALEIVVLVYSLRIFQHCAPSKLCWYNTLFIFQVIFACASFFPIMMGCVSSLIKNIYILAGYAIFVLVFGITQLIVGLLCQSIATDEFLESNEYYVWVQATLVIIYAVLFSLLEIGGATLSLVLAYLVQRQHELI